VPSCGIVLLCAMLVISTRNSGFTSSQMMQKRAGAAPGKNSL
jgi:hypothetical protein